MKINRIQLSNFRNIASIDLQLCENANVIYGENAQGKTNFVEAVWLFTGAKSFRGAKDNQMVRFDTPKAKIEMDFYAGDRDQNAVITIENRRSVILNDIPLRSQTDIAGHFCAVVFSPTDLALVKNGPQEKRKFIDTSICQLKPKYIHMLSQYTRVLDQRNRLLKDIPSNPRLSDTLDIWDARLAGFAAVIMKTRCSFLDRLRPFAQQTYAGISGEKEKMDFSYFSSLACDLTGDIPFIEKQALTALQANRSEDIKTRMTNYGPHRDDINIVINQNNARLYGSQGQQRSCVLALKMAETELIRETIGEYPVVLLDDVMSELDASRREYLLNHLKNRQLIITCCDRAYFKTLGKGVGIRIQNGETVLVRKY